MPKELTDPKEILLYIARNGGFCTYCDCSVCEKTFQIRN